MFSLHGGGGGGGVKLFIFVEKTILFISCFLCIYAISNILFNFFFFRGGGCKKNVSGLIFGTYWREISGGRVALFVQV